MTSGLGNIDLQLNVASDEDTSNNGLTTSAFVIENTITTTTSGVITVEAENFSFQTTPNPIPVENDYNPAWYVVSNTTSPNVLPDFDSVEASSTSNNSYVEFLPDTRLGDSDPIKPNVSNFADGGESAVLSYDIFVNEAGRYYVSALLRANNAQDSSIFVGLNNQWPATTANLTVCTPDGSWKWSNSPLCNTTTGAYVDIANPGVHSLMVSAATDGVELDKIALTLDSASLPTGIGAESKLYIAPEIDLSISSQKNSDIYTVTITNPDTRSTVANILVELKGIDVTQAENITGFDGCEARDDLINCTIDFVAANNERTASLELIDNTEIISATLISATDNNTNNNFTSAKNSGGGLVDMRWLITLLSICCLRLLTTRRSLQS